MKNVHFWLRKEPIKGKFCLSVGPSVRLSALCSEALLKDPKHPPSTPEAPPKHPPKHPPRGELQRRATEES